MSEIRNIANLLDISIDKQRELKRFSRRPYRAAQKLNEYNIADKACDHAIDEMMRRAICR